MKPKIKRVVYASIVKYPNNSLGQEPSFGGQGGFFITLSLTNFWA